MEEHKTHLPVLTRRDLWRIGGVSIVGRALLPMIAGRLNAAGESNVQPRNTADCVIFLNLVGSPSQMDTFDVKEGNWTPGDLDIRTVKQGIKWPFGLLPKTADILDEAVIIRSMAAWETLHNLAQYYQQVGHQYTPARGTEMPSIGSVIAYELLQKARPDDFLPPHISMNFPTSAVNGPLIREGFLDSNTAPLTMDMRPGGNRPFVLPESERDHFNRRLDFLESFDSMRQMKGSGVSKRFLEWESFTQSSVKMIRSPKIAEVFRLDEADQTRYGKTSFGDACIIARNMVAAQAGARYILVNAGGWDHHANIYNKRQAANGEAPEEGDARGLYACCKELDSAFAALVSDLKTLKGKSGASLLDRTLIVAAGEFGRTPGPLNSIKGRDHWAGVRSGVFVGGGVKGGRVLGATDEIGGKITKFEWHKDRPVYPEDVTATIYSALGIDWTKRLNNTPSGRFFQYIEPMSGTNAIGSTEITELFG
jgi:hypothetical protein